jgi:hypothetical protein
MVFPALTETFSETHICKHFRDAVLQTDRLAGLRWTGLFIDDAQPDSKPQALMTQRKARRACTDNEQRKDTVHGDD